MDRLANGDIFLLPQPWLYEVLIAIRFFPGASACLTLPVLAGASCPDSGVGDKQILYLCSAAT
jgi:hypothetical protein